MMRTGQKSYHNWACSLTIVAGITISKQAIFKKMNELWLKLVKMLLQKVMSKQSMKNVKLPLFSHFNHVWLQDSTSINLPAVMVAKFKGNISRGKQKAVAKINVIMDVLTGACPVMDLMALSVNEQGLSESILSIAKKGDLVIRDLGYFVLPAFKKMIEADIELISRLKYNVNLYDVKSGEKLEFAQLIKGKKFIDIKAKCGAKEQVEMRLVAIKIPPEQAAERRRKAKKDRDKRLNHSEEYYALLDYVIFITTVDKEIWNYKQVAEAYGVRWNIEILFKSWKSGFKIEDMIPEDKEHAIRVESYIYMMLLYIAWFQLIVFIPLRAGIKKKSDKVLSIIKTVNYVMAHFNDWLFEAISIKDLRRLDYLCCYDNRRRSNAVADLDMFYKQLS